MAKLMFFSGPYQGKTVGLPHGKSITMGRNRDLELPLPDLKLSRRHCQITFRNDHYFLTDLRSTNGTFLNGERIQGEVPLNDFDRIVIGDIEIEFHHAEKMPLPMSFDASAPDPFGLGAEEDQVDLESLPQVEEPLASAPVRGMAETIRRAVVPPPRPRPPGRPTAAAVPRPPQPARPSGRTAPPSLKSLVGLPGAGGTSEPQPANGIQRVSVALAPEILEAALCDLDLPLPPEPPPLATFGQPAALRPELLFCAACEGSIPVLDYDLGVARRVDGRLLCGECIAKSPSPDAQSPAPAAVLAQRVEERKKSVDEILKALDEEAVIIDTKPKRGAPPPPATGPSGRRTASQKTPEELGEEFEEIG